MATHTPTVWELDLLTLLRRDGASGSAMDMLTIPTITHGGDRWAITAMAGIHITAGEPGEGQRRPTCTGCGGIRPTPARARLGRIHTRGIMVQPHAVATTTARPAGAQLPDGVTTRISTRATQAVIA